MDFTNIAQKSANVENAGTLVYLDVTVQTNDLIWGLAGVYNGTPSLSLSNLTSQLVGKHEAFGEHVRTDTRYYGVICPEGAAVYLWKAQADGVARITLQRGAYNADGPLGDLSLFVLVARPDADHNWKLCVDSYTRGNKRTLRAPVATGNAIYVVQYAYSSSPPISGLEYEAWLNTIPGQDENLDDARGTAIKATTSGTATIQTSSVYAIAAWADLAQARRRTQIVWV